MRDGLGSRAPFSRAGPDAAVRRRRLDAHLVQLHLLFPRSPTDCFLTFIFHCLQRQPEGSRREQQTTTAASTPPPPPATRSQPHRASRNTGLCLHNSIPPRQSARRPREVVHWLRPGHNARSHSNKPARSAALGPAPTTPPLPTSTLSTTVASPITHHHISLPACSAGVYVFVCCAVETPTSSPAGAERPFHSLNPTKSPSLPPRFTTTTTAHPAETPRPSATSLVIHPRIHCDIRSRQHMVFHSTVSLLRSVLAIAVEARPTRPPPSPPRCPPRPCVSSILNAIKC